MAGRATQTPYLFPLGATLGSDNLVLHAKSRRHIVTDYAGPLSIKTVLSGTVKWITGGREMVVDSSSFLVLGEGERYSMDIDEPRAVETACAFFRRGFVEEIARDATTEVDACLASFGKPAPALRYLSRVHPDLDRSILNRVQTLARRCGYQLQPSAFEEDFLDLSHELLLLYEEIRSRIGRIAATKASTRDELFRRVEIAREYMHAQGEGSVSLEDAARAACLSPYHFHRAFREAMGKTPHAYLTELRLARAHAGLRAGQPVVQVCLTAGFLSHSSFSRLFRRAYGISPSAVRRSTAARA